MKNYQCSVLRFDELQVGYGTSSTLADLAGPSGSTVCPNQRLGRQAAWCCKALALAGRRGTGTGTGTGTGGRPGQADSEEDYEVLAGRLGVQVAPKWADSQRSSNCGK